jgi:hypothetical protein
LWVFWLITIWLWQWAIELLLSGNEWHFVIFFFRKVDRHGIGPTGWWWWWCQRFASNQRFFTVSSVSFVKPRKTWRRNPRRTVDSPKKPLRGWFQFFCSYFDLAKSQEGGQIWRKPKIPIYQILIHNNSNPSKFWFQTRSNWHRDYRNWDWVGPLSVRNFWSREYHHTLY